MTDKFLCMPDREWLQKLYKCTATKGLHLGVACVRSGGRAAQSYVEVQSALCGLLALRTMPVAGLWTTAWLVLQLVPRAEQQSPPDPGSGNPGDAAAWGSHLSSHQRGVLSQAWTAARDHLMEQMGGAQMKPICRSLLVQTPCGRCIEQACQ